MNEIWKPVVGYEGFYDVSNLGRVRSLPRVVISRGGTRVSPGRILKDSCPQRNYHMVILFKHGLSKTIAVHRLVLIAFVGSPPNGHEAFHWNGHGKDNRLANLRWDTRKANRDDDVRLNVRKRGEQRAWAKLNIEKVKQLRERVASGESMNKVAITYGVHPGTIGKICRHEKWNHV